jgi:tetratricopeptide (TPR) repeat protein
MAMLRLAMAMLLGVAAVMDGCTATVADRKALAAGYTDYQARKFDEAEAAANGYLAKYPSADNADEALYLRGLARLGRGDKGGAAQDLRAAIARSRRKDLQAKAHRALGDIAFDGTQWAEAQKEYATALTSGAGGTEAGYVNYRLGAALQAQGRWDEAKPYLEKAAVGGDAAVAERAREREGARYFTLQFGSFREAGNANALVREVNGANVLSGQQAGVFPEAHDGQTLYAVRAGGYATWAAADGARAKVLGKYPLVTVYP